VSLRNNDDEILPASMAASISRLFVESVLELIKETSHKLSIKQRVAGSS
jgi:hypothetical protein